jgi:hypothetical protein
MVPTGVLYAVLLAEHPKLIEILAEKLVERALRQRAKGNKYYIDCMKEHFCLNSRVVMLVTRCSKGKGWHS